MLIAFAGIDGAGKSTQAKTLARRLAEAGRSVKVIDKWDVLDPRIHPECRFIDSRLEEVRVCISEMEGPGRALFLFWCIALATTRSMKESHDYFISDGYWMKHAAAELAMGCPRAMIDGYVEALPPADLTFYFDLEPGLAYERKGAADVTPYECGCDPEMKPEGFIRHQAGIRTILKDWAARDGWVSIDATRDRDTIGQDITAHVLKDSGRVR
jgi:dTMP kinase